MKINDYVAVKAGETEAEIMARAAFDKETLQRLGL